MYGIPHHILTPLRETLKRCAPFANITELSALFAIEESIAIWQDRLPDITGLTLISRIDVTIDYLFRQANLQNENGLILFLQVLADDIDSEHYDHLELITLTSKLKAYLRDRINIREETDNENIPESNSFQILCFEHIKIILWHAFRRWFIQFQNISPNKLKRVHVQLHPLGSIWVKPEELEMGELLPHISTEEMPLRLTLKSKPAELGITLNYLVPKMGRPFRAKKSFQFLE